VSYYNRYRDGGSVGSAVSFPTRVKGPLVQVEDYANSVLVPEPIEGDKYFLHNLGDVEGMLAYAAGCRYREDSRDGSWAGCHSLQEAFTLAVSGWDEVSGTVDKLASGLVKAVGSRSIIPEPYLHEEGETVDVAAFMGGEPEAFINFRPVERDGAGKVIKLTINTCVSAGIETDVILARGAAALAAVRLLELAGFSVEVGLATADAAEGHWAHAMVKRHTGSEWSNSYSFNLTATVKYADQPTDMGKLAFWLCHPAAFRHITFRVWDRWGLTTPYGTPVECPQELQGDIHLSQAHLNQIQWSNPEAATTWIKEQLVKQGIEIE
jgi:hypothetical protein